ncbi:glycosyltransferase family 4 protein [Tolypothrix campylonemoides VB511288]|nr:glycosyltransferase family 4 protein [Tolypothrix campylonemoides VB511288]
MKSLRILIVTHAPLSPEFGAGQMAINLAEALRNQGHDVTLWSPHPLVKKVGQFQNTRLMRLKLESFLQSQKPFDVIDSPAALITRKVSQSAIIVARSVQPDILYLISSLNDTKKENILKKNIRILTKLFYIFIASFYVIQGWKRAKYILCLGSLEMCWMKKWFPWWRNKLSYYVNALSKTEQKTLAEIRSKRSKKVVDNTRFIWIGRWVFHKGYDDLKNFLMNWSRLRPQDSFTIAGCGNCFEKDELNSSLVKCNLNFISSFKRDELPHLLASHDVGLFTSKVEGWGLVLNEMLESGMPVFATPSGGVPDLQPFFQEELKPFPASLESITNIPINIRDLTDYYKVFDWNAISLKYLEMIFSSFSLV